MDDNNNSISMEKAAKDLCDSCTKAFGTDPFSSPTAIFNDAKAEQWFKKFYLDKVGTFANIRFMTIGEFMKDYLGDPPTLLCHHIYSELRASIDNYQEVSKYCKNDDGTIEDGKLFDLSNRLAELFLEYRQLDKEPEEFFNKKDSVHGEWERRLYESVFPHDNSTKTKPSSQSNIFYFGPKRLTKLQVRVLDENHCTKFLYTEAITAGDITEFPYISVRAVPSKIREVEELHSQVCQLLQKGVNLSDMIVVIPNVDDYRTAIHQVFDIPKGDQNVHIPYNIVEPDYSSTFTKDLLEKLFFIARKQDFSRKDFFELLGNPVLRAARGISATDVEAFKNWVGNMNVYREEKRGDWRKSVNRMLLSRLTTESICNYLPYEDMASKSNDTLLSFIQLVNDLENWLKVFQDGYIRLKSETNPTPIDELKEILRSWIHIDPREEGFDADRISYAGAIGSFRAFDVEKKEGMEALSLDVIERTVLSGAMSTEYSPAEIFTGGLTICKFSTSHVLPAKYTFLLGMDSKVLPGTDDTDTLDLRGEKDYIHQTELNKLTFFTTIRETGAKVFLSYVNRDLAKDEEFFQSPLVAELLKKSEAAGKPESEVVLQPLGLDETRPWSELFTSRSFRNKVKDENLTQGSIKENLTMAKIKELQNNCKAPKAVNINQLKNFLSDPFIFLIGRIMPQEDKSQLEDDYEPTQLDSLQVWSYLHEIVTSDITKDDFAKKHHLDSSIPDDPFSHNLVDALFDEKERIEAQMRDQPYSFDLKKDVIKGERCNLDLGTFILRGEYSWRNDDGTIFMDVSANSDPKPKNSKFLSMYLSALAYWAEKNLNERQTITLLLFTSDGKVPTKELTLQNSQEARDLLGKIYEAAYKTHYSQEVPIDLLGEEKLDYQKYCGEFNESHGPWDYFAQKDLFDIREVCGFQEDKFADEWVEAKNSVKSMVII
jgi:exonuclease V gamma subunit